MKPFFIAFIGNKQVSNREAVFKTLFFALEEAYGNKDYEWEQVYPVFLCGGYGQFSQIAAEVIDALREKYPAMKSKKLFVSPYLTPSYLKTIEYMKDFYDDIVYPALETVPPKFAISRRNQWMIDRCDMLIAYMEYSFGDTRKCVDYAIRKHKLILYVGWGKTESSFSYRPKEKREQK